MAFEWEGKKHPKDAVFRRTVKAKRELVFAAFTEPRHLVNWWPPKPFTMPRCEVTLKPGGSWRYAFRSPEGQEHACEARYEVVEPPSRLVMTQAVPGPGGKPFFTIRQTIRMEERGGDTELFFEAKVLEANPGSEPFLDGMEQGTKMTLDNLGEYLSGNQFNNDES